MDNLQQSFIAEAEELLSHLESVLLEFDKDLANKDSIEAIFRVMHNLKGSASMFGFEHLSALTHDLETIYDVIREGRFPATREILDVTLQSVDHLNKIIKDKELAGSDNRIKHAQLLERIQLIERSLRADDAPHKSAITSDLPAQKATYYVCLNPGQNIFKSGTNPLYLIEDLTSLGDAVVIPCAEKIPSLQDISADLCYTSFEVILATDKSITDIREVFLFAAHSCEVITERIAAINLLTREPFCDALRKAKLEPSPLGLVKVKSMVEAAKAESSGEIAFAATNGSSKGKVTSIRVSSDKLEELMNLISELVTSQARLTLLTQQRGFRELIDLSENMEKIARRLRDNAFNICLIPLQTLETRFQRLVRDLSNELNKDIAFTAEGVETELDKSIIEKITDPILHILRNCIDHGIEAPDDRISKGKNRQGRIEMKAYQSGTSVHIQIKDDGKGINPERIRAKAISKGLISPDAVLSDQELIEMIFHPGFSTAEQVTDVSGRGVGMDIVKRNIQAVHGEVALKSKIDEGTTITIKLPLTLSIVDGMLVRIASSEYILPLTIVDKCFEIETEKLQPVLTQKFVLDGHLIPVFNLREAFQEHGSKPEITQIIKIHHDEFAVGITVDAVIGQYQAVMKPLGNLYSAQNEFSGATILGDGTVALVIDTARLIRQLSTRAQLEQI
jgi:two-component system chemotaxis sensor kinase CheA